MKIIDSGRQAVGAMLENKTRTVLMMLGVVIGVATLTMIASSVMGARAQVMGQIEKWGLDQIMVDGRRWAETWGSSACPDNPED